MSTAQHRFSTPQVLCETFCFKFLKQAYDRFCKTEVEVVEIRKCMLVKFSDHNWLIKDVNKTFIVESNDIWFDNLKTGCCDKL